MKIPITIEEATDALTGIEALLTKKGWERAAIVAAFVRLPGAGARTDLAESSQVFTPNTFTTLDIAGLRSKDTVRTYVQTWLDAHDGIYPEPGAEVELPEGDYPPGGPRGNTQDELIQSAARKGTLVDKLTPEQRVEVATAIIDVVPKADVNAVHEKVVKRVMADHELERMASGHPPVVIPPPTYDVWDAVSDITNARLRLEKAGAEFLAAVKDYGALTDEDPTTAYVRTVVMEVMDLITVNTDVDR